MRLTFKIGMALAFLCYLRFAPLPMRSSLSLNMTETENLESGAGTSLKGNLVRL